MARRTRSGSFNTSKPATSAEPESGLDKVLRIFIVVDLPAPLGPSSAKTAPDSTVKLRPSSARTLPPYVLTRSRTSIAGAARPEAVFMDVVVSGKESIIKISTENRLEFRPQAVIELQVIIFTMIACKVGQFAKLSHL